MSVAEQGSPAPSLRRLPFTVRLSPQLVNELAEQRSMVNASGEVSGLLFGRLEDGVATAQIRRAPAVKATAAGTGNGQESSSMQFVADLPSDPIVEGDFTKIGWYSCRSSGGLHNSDRDYHNREFHTPNEIALLVTPGVSGEVVFEVYCRTTAGEFTEEKQRMGSVSVSSQPVDLPLEIVPLMKLNDDFFLRAYDQMAEDEVQGRHISDFKAQMQKIFSFWRSEAEEESATQQVPPVATTPYNLATSPVNRKLSAWDDDSPSTTPSVLRFREGQTASRKPLWPTALAAFSATSIITFGAIFYLRTSDHLPSLLEMLAGHEGLGFKAEAQGDRLLLKWNKQNAVVRHAKGGMLLIEDGALKRQVPLDALQVSNGSILYRPKTDDVTFRIEVVGLDGGKVEDSMKVLDSGKEIAQSGAPAKEPALPTASKPDISSLRHSFSNPKPALEVAAAKNEGSAAKELVAPDKPAPESTAQESAKIDAAKVDTNAEEVQAIPDEPSTIQASKPSILEQNPAPAVPPLQALPAPTTSIPDREVEGPSIYQPPKPIRQVLPTITSLPSAVLTQTGQLEVLVRVDETGRVTDAQPVTNGKKLNQMLIASSLRAARLWRFQPASMHGKPMASQHSIIFQFAPRN